MSLTQTEKEMAKREFISASADFQRGFQDLWKKYPNLLLEQWALILAQENERMMEHINLKILNG